MRPSSIPRWTLALLAAVTVCVAAPPIDTGRELYAEGQFQQAAVIFARISSADPTEAAARFYLGKISIRQADYAVAMRHLERAVALAPQESDYQVWLGNSYAWAASVASLGEKAGLGRKCLAAYRQAIALNPDNIAAHVSLMNFYRHVPPMFGGGLDKAYAEAEAVRQRNADKGQWAIAILCLQEKKCAQAVALLTALARRNPSDYAVHCALGKVAIETGTHLEEAEAAFGRCLELRPTEEDDGHDFVQWGLGKIAEMKHALPEARLAYEDSLRLNPAFKPAKDSLARLR
jgi:tetratricopeptide (TPR) repeat protein